MPIITVSSSAIARAWVSTWPCEAQSTSTVFSSASTARAWPVDWSSALTTSATASPRTRCSARIIRTLCTITAAHRIMVAMSAIVAKLIIALSS